jgi:hypothetical protein
MKNCILFLIVGLVFARSVKDSRADLRMAEQVEKRQMSVLSEREVMAGSLQKRDIPPNSVFVLEWGLNDVDIIRNLTTSPPFSFQKMKFVVQLGSAKKKQTTIGIRLFDPTTTIFPGSLHFLVVIVGKIDKTISTFQNSFIFYEGNNDSGPTFRFPAKLPQRDYSLKVKVFVDYSFSDFVEKSASFEAYPRSLLFERSFSNLSFKLGSEAVYVIQDVLTSRCEYFKDMLERAFAESKEPMTAESMIPIQEIDVVVFKMIIEWIYTNDILQLNELSSTILFDLGRAHIAADFYGIPELCDSIERYLIYLINLQTFGDIYQIAMNIGSERVVREVYRRLVQSELYTLVEQRFSANFEQINVMIQAEKEEVDRDNGEEKGSEEQINAAIIVIMKQNIDVCDIGHWRLNPNTNMSVIERISNILIANVASRKRKMRNERLTYLLILIAS